MKFRDCLIQRQGWMTGTVGVNAQMCHQTHFARNGPTFIWAVNQRRQQYIMREKAASSINDAGKTGQLCTKESNWTSFS